MEESKLLELYREAQAAKEDNDLNRYHECMSGIFAILQAEIMKVCNTEHGLYIAGRDPHAKPGGSLGEITIHKKEKDGE